MQERKESLRREKKPEKKAYSTPRLTVHGDVSGLTKSTTGAGGLDVYGSAS